MTTTKTEPFQVTRIPSTNGEWIDVHLGLSGRLCVTTSGYAEVDGPQLIAALETVLQTR